VEITEQNTYGSRNEATTRMILSEVVAIIVIWQCLSLNSGLALKHSTA
jgi:hypothetical protein